LVVTRTERRSGNLLIAYGRAPVDFHVVAFFNAPLAKAGFSQLDRYDAESDFTGPAVRGRWKTEVSTDCALRPASRCW